MDIGAHLCCKLARKFSQTFRHFHLRPRGTRNCHQGQLHTRVVAYVPIVSWTQQHSTNEELRVQFAVYLHSYTAK